MNIQLLKDQKNKNPWDEIFSHPNEDSEIKHEAQMLMFEFLSEVEKYQQLQGITKKTLAQKVKTSASYITQLFRGNKPLNFETVIKFEKALKIKFSIIARPNTDEMVVDEMAFIDIIKCQYSSDKGFWIWKNIDLTKDEKYLTEDDDTLIENVLNIYENKTVFA